MSELRILTRAEAEELVAAVLIAHETSDRNAASVARALVAAEIDGQSGHGLSRVAAYAAQARAGKVDGRAEPRLARAAGALLRVDACSGFAFPAIDAAIEALAPLARETGIAAAAIFRSHHFGQAGAHVERLAERGLVALLFGNSPQAMAFWGGARPRLGTNPIAFAAPRTGGPPLVIDLALSRAARGKVMAAKQRGRPIPEGWALGPDGAPTADPEAALAGSMIPIGEAKGAALALMVEILAAAIAGANFGWEASSYFDDQGPPPHMGQLLIAIDPGPASGGAFDARLATLLQAMAEDGVRAPGDSRLARRARAAAEGLAIAADLHGRLAALAGG